MGDFRAFSSLAAQQLAPAPPIAVVSPPIPPPQAPASLSFLANEGLAPERLSYLFFGSNKILLTILLACVDKTTLCWRWLDRCQSFFFEKIMREFCALSCGYCTPNTAAAAAIVPPPPPPPPFLPPVPIVPPSAQLFNRDTSSISLNAGSVVPDEQPFYLRFG